MNIDKKNVLWNMIGATANAFISLVLTVFATRINGIDEAGVYTYAFSMACLLFVVGIYEGRAFQVTDTSGKYSDTDYIYNRIFTCVIMICAGIVFCAVKRYDVQKSAVIMLLCAYKCLEAFAEAVYAIIQKHNRLYNVGISMTLKAVFSTILFFAVDIITKDLIASCISIAAINLVFILFYDLPMAKRLGIVKTKYSNKNNRSIFAAGFFTFSLTFLGLYLINAPKYAIDDLLTNDVQTIFGIIIMPATFMGLLGQYIIQPMLTKVALFTHDKDYGRLRKSVLSVIALIFILGAVVFAVAFLLEEPVLSFVYGIDLAPYKTLMMIIILGSVMYSLGIMISFLLIAFRKTMVQTVIYAVVSVAATMMSYSLVRSHGIGGAAVTYSVSMTIVAVTFAVYLYFTMSKFKKEWKKV